MFITKLVQFVSVQLMFYNTVVLILFITFVQNKKGNP